MEMGSAKYLTWVLTAGMWLAASGTGWAQDVVAVLSSNLVPYREALEGFQEVFGESVPTYNLSENSPKLPPGTRVVVSFGGKAALFPYPEAVTLIYAMAPGIDFKFAKRPGPSVQIEMLTDERAIVPKLKDIQPALKRLAVLWVSNSIDDNVERMQEASAPMEIEIVPERLKSPDELPERLRSIYKDVDAIWLMPDPFLINSQSFAVLKEFSWSNKVPLYVPAAGLVEQGATASISASFREIGRAAASAARRVLAKKPVEDPVYPEKVETVLSLKAATNAGLLIPPDVVKSLDKVVP